MNKLDKKKSYFNRIDEHTKNIYKLSQDYRSFQDKIFQMQMRVTDLEREKYSHFSKISMYISDESKYRAQSIIKEGEANRWYSYDRIRYEVLKREASELRSKAENAKSMSKYYRSSVSNLDWKIKNIRSKISFEERWMKTTQEKILRYRKEVSDIQAILKSGVY